MRAFALLCFFVISVTLDAQITITSADMPFMGDTFRYSFSDSLVDFSPLETGPGQFWDYSNVSVKYQSVDTFVSVLETHPGFILLFGGPANLAAKTTMQPPPGVPDTISGNTGFSFFDKSSGAYTLVGEGTMFNGIPVPTIYQQPDTLYTFPLSYGSVDTTYAYSSMEIPTYGGVYTDLMRMTEVDGYGTLITPLDTFDVLRVRSEIISVDSVAFQGTTQIFESTSVEYKWLGKASGVPIMQVNTFELPIGTEVITTVKFLDTYHGQSPTEAKPITGNSIVRVYPTIIGKGEAINIELKDAELPGVNISLYDLGGALTWSRNYSGAGHQGSFRVHPDLKSGMYIVQVKNGKKKFTCKVVVTP